MVCRRLWICAVDGHPLARSRAVTALPGEFSIFLHGNLCGFSMQLPFKKQRRSCDRCILGVSDSGSQQARDNSLAASDWSVTSWPLSVCCYFKIHCRNTQSGIMQNYYLYEIPQVVFHSPLILGKSGFFLICVTFRMFWVLFWDCHLPAMCLVALGVCGWWCVCVYWDLWHLTMPSRR